jgi:hypothetical protein
MSVPLPTRLFIRTVAAVIAAAIAVATSGCATAASGGSSGAATAKVLSPGPTYAGGRPVARLYAYIYLDMRTDFVPEAFRRAANNKLADAFHKSGVANEQLWFSDTAQAAQMRADPKRHAMGDMTMVSIGKTVEENAQRNSAFAPTHYLIAFPQHTWRSGKSASMEVKWDVIDSRNGYVEWSVYTKTPLLSASMDTASAEAAATALVDAIVDEMRAKNVIPRPKA